MNQKVVKEKCKILNPRFGLNKFHNRTQGKLYCPLKIKSELSETNHAAARRVHSGESVWDILRSSTTQEEIIFWGKRLKKEKFTKPAELNFKRVFLLLSRTML